MCLLSFSAAVLVNSKLEYSQLAWHFLTLSLNRFMILNLAKYKVQWGSDSKTLNFKSLVKKCLACWHTAYTPYNVHIFLKISNFKFFFYIFSSFNQLSMKLHDFAKFTPISNFVVQLQMHDALLHSNIVHVTAKLHHKQMKYFMLRVT